VKTASPSDKVVGYTGGHHRGIRDDTLVKKDWETRETLPIQLPLFEGEFKTESYKAEPKEMRGWEGVGAVHSSCDYRDNTTRYSEGTAVQPMPALQRGAFDCRKASNGHLKAQELQRRLYLKSKRERRCRFYSLYDKVCHPDILREAWLRVKRNRGLQQRGWRRRRVWNKRDRGGDRGREIPERDRGGTERGKIQAPAHTEGIHTEAQWREETLRDTYHQGQGGADGGKDSH
jgi:hypothetical protein